MPNSDDRMLLNAALDGELDAAGMIGIERRLAVDQALAAEYQRLRTLRRSIAVHAARVPVPERLRARVMSELDRETGRAGVPPRMGVTAAWRRLAASIAAIAVIAAGSYALLSPSSRSDATTRAIVAGYMRAQVSGRPIDVASSDRHTVKPWLAGKVPLATAVVDLSVEGFPLAGARVDIVEGTAVPTLVYQRREHFVSVTELASRSVQYPKTMRREAIDGYSVLVWEDGERAYAAVSDMPPGELDGFVAIFRRAVARDREETGQRPP
jgi:anti-sigma factor RsiW